MQKNQSTDRSALLRQAAQRAPVLSAEQEAELVRLAQAGNEVAFERLLTAHFRLVLAIAHEQRSYGLPTEELVAEGMLGLVEAARRFDQERGVRLAVYAAWWIRAYTRRFTLGNRRIVRPPSTRHGRKLLANLRKTQRKLEAITGGEASSEAIAQDLGVPQEDVIEMVAALSGRDLPCGPVDGETRGYEPIAQEENPETQVAEAELATVRQLAVESALDELSPREQQILRLRFFGQEFTSLAAIGRDLGLSRERVRQLAQQAEGKLRTSVLSSAV